MQLKQTYLYLITEIKQQVHHFSMYFKRPRPNFYGCSCSKMAAHVFQFLLPLALLLDA